MPMKIRKNLLFIMMRSGKTSKITAGKIMDMSMASACSVRMLLKQNCVCISWIVLSKFY